MQGEMEVGSLVAVLATIEMLFSLSVMWEIY